MTDAASEHFAAPDHLLFIVVGAHIDAERRDRPLGYRLREGVLRWIDRHQNDHETAHEYLEHPIEPVVCSDLWYLNQDDVHERPTIAVGDPEANALSAFLATRLPAAFVVDETFQVLMDPELNTLCAALWGCNVSACASAVDLFAERYLDEFLRRAHGLRTK